MKWVFTVSILLMFGNMDAQTSTAVEACSAYKQQHPETQQPAVADAREEEYDVHYVKLDLAMDNLTTKVSGSVTTQASAVKHNMSEYVFELIADYTIDSVTIDHVLVNVTHLGPVHSALLPFTLAQGTPFEAKVYYHGEVPSGSGLPVLGIRTQAATDWNAHVTYTLSEPYAAREWWPCKQSLEDKIDSSDVWITVPQSLKAGSNGLLQQVTPMPGNTSRYEWKSRNKIDYYLISAAVGPYVDYSFYMHFTDSNDSMLVQNYIYDDPGALPSYKNGIDSTAIMINYFSDRLGRYPFWKEKYGHCLTTLGGGMEHQTMTTLGGFNYMLVAHELAHQWFGDHVTCRTWSDIWLNEGFATYLAWTFMDYSRGSTASFADMEGVIHNSVMSQPGGSVYSPDTTNTGRLFDGRLTYNKGAAVIHTLSSLFNDTASFYQMLRDYQQLYAYGNANTEQFKTLAAASLGRNLDTFFNEWIYGEGFPVYNAWWNQQQDQVVIRLQQEGSMPSSVPLFHTALDIRLYAAGGLDTTITVRTDAHIQQYVLHWNRPVERLALDPRNYIINRTDSIKHDHALQTDGFDTGMYLVYPNPGKDYWNIDGMPAHADLVLCDVSGRTLWKGVTGNYNSARISTTLLSRGMYLLHVVVNGHQRKALKLIKTE